MIKSSISVFAFEPIECLSDCPKGLFWRSVELTHNFGLHLLQHMAIEHNLQFTNHKSRSTIIVNLYTTRYMNEVIEMHLTGVKKLDLNAVEVITRLHLTVRVCAKEIKAKSVYYDLQHGGGKFYRFVKNEFEDHNQNDNIDEFIGQQGFYNFSSAVLQKILTILADFHTNSTSFLSSKYIFLNKF
jgi:hypothetical protein